MDKRNSIFRTKSVADLLAEASGKSGLKKSLGAFELTMLGIGAVVGTGIFVLTGVAAANYSGPALIISFLIAGAACAFAGLAYAEFASMVPVAGSAYTYGYAALGEFWAWIIGWDLILEYTVAVSAVAVGWSGYIVSLMESAFGITVPTALCAAPGVEGGFINLPAMLIMIGITLLLISGAKESARFNTVIVIIKITVVLIFIIIGAFNVDPGNWSPFMPYGFSGVIKGASIIIFAYLGFDAVSTAAEEVKNPQRDLPIGIIGSLIVCTILYILVSGILTGIVPYIKFKETAAPVAYALQQAGINWGASLVAVGAICGITSVLLVMTFGQTRIFFAMSRDGLLPKVFGSVSPRFGTPVKSTILVGTVCAMLAGFTPIGILAELCNIGTLAAFVIVSAAVCYMRKKQPDLKRGFKCPGVPVIPIIAIAFNFYLLLNLPHVTHLRFVIWLALGFIIYFLYGRKHSTMNVQNPSRVIHVKDHEDVRI